MQNLATIDLSRRRIAVQIRGAVSGQGIKLNVEGVAIVEIAVTPTDPAGCAALPRPAG